MWMLKLVGRSVVEMRSVVAVVTALSLVLTPGTWLVIGVAAQNAQQGTSGEASDADVDLGWPRGYETPNGGEIVVYQPQISSWEDQRRLVALSAVSYMATGATEAALGVVTLEADTQVSLDERLVDLGHITISESNFPSLSREQLREVVTQLVQDALPPEDRIIALDRVLENLDQSQVTARGVEGVKADPPRIFWSTGPAMLVILDGDPIWAPIEGLDLQFAVNTNWDLFQRTASNATTLYVRHEDVWMTAPALDGPWTPAGDLPDSFSNLPADDNWSGARENVPGRRVRGDDVPRVFTTTEPAELIALDGEASYETVEGTVLEWVANTESDLFRLGREGIFYYLVAGRWFSAPTLDGPWAFATPTLPGAFQEIPVEHERSRVLASVPGSDQANEAILLAQVPRTARVNRDMEAPEVVYQGEPEFVAIDPTMLERAVNTDKDVIKAGDLYYMCVQGVWFTSMSATEGWEVATSVPQEIYNIPASSPVHHVTYVTVEESNDAAVTFAYVAGYTGLMIAFGAVMWGSGWYYPPYVWYGGRYPVYYRYPVTYGMGAWYNPWSGAYGRGARAYGPYGGAGWGASYNPRTGTYARGAAAYGPYNSRAAAQAWNPRTGTYAQTRQGSNVYGSWGSTSVQRGDDWVNTKRVTNSQGTTTRVTRTDDGAAVSRRGPGGGGVAVGSGGNVYAGNDGNVYRRGDDGWQKREDGGWSTVDTPERTGDRAGTQATNQTGRSGTTGTPNRGTIDRLEGDRTSRNSGRTRTRDYGSYKRGGSSRGSAGSYRSGGRSGGRGGGRRR